LQFLAKLFELKLGNSEITRHAKFIEPELIELKLRQALRALSLPTTPTHPQPSRMPKATQPELKKVDPYSIIPPSLLVHKFPKDVLNPKYMDKRLFVQLNGSRKVIGVLRGYDVVPPFCPCMFGQCLFVVGVFECCA
jgi:hypothetical protein